jgi:general secretion pathway protein F
MVFEYAGLDGGGKAVKGIVEADTAKVARSRLRKQGVFPTDVWEQREGAAKGTGLSTEIDFSKYFERVSAEDLAAFTSQLSTLIGAAVPMVEALAAMVEQTENRKLKAVLSDVRSKVNEGSSLARALRAHPTVFNDLFVNMVDAGEQSGALDVVLKRLTAYTEGQVALRAKLIGAITYPILMMGIASIVVLSLFTFVLPKLRRVFDSFDKALPLFTQMMFAASDFITGWWWAVLIVGSVGGWFFRRYIRTPDGRRWWHQRLLRLPVFGRINRIVAVSRFCRTLSTLLSSGVPILTALGIVRSVVGNDIIASAVEAATRNISEGQSIAIPLKQSGEFPAIVTHMIATGEKTGELEGMLARVADSYDAQVENTVNTLTSLLTPVLTLVMGGVVFSIALGVLLPMMNLSSIVR